MPGPGTLLLAVAAAAGAIGLAVLAAALLAQGAEERDLATRLRLLLRPAAPLGGDKRVRTHGLLRPVVRLGEALRDSAIISPKEVAGFQRAMAAAGYDPRHAVPLFLGAKALLLVALPLAALAQTTTGPVATNTALPRPPPGGGPRASAATPSPSSWLCVTMAPCRSSSTASQPRATAAQMRLAMCSKAASSTWPLGQADAAMGTSTSAPTSSASCKKAPSAEPVPR
jgi:hypothetical protein